MKKNSLYIFLFFFSVSLTVRAQNNTFSPYSRYGVGELTQSTFAHNAGMGGAFIAHKPDSTMPIFINAGNPAAYSLIRLTSLEVGGTFLRSDFNGTGGKNLSTWGTNFAYGALGFPILGNGGLCFGIMPYSTVGYETENKSNLEGIGNITYRHNGSGGLNKAFLGYGIMPFNKRLSNYRNKRRYAITDSLNTTGKIRTRSGEFFSKMLADLSIGFNANYIFGSIFNTTRVIYPAPNLFNNTYRERNLTMGDFTGNFGVQLAASVDSVVDRKRRSDFINAEITRIKTEQNLSEDQLAYKRDSLQRYVRVFRRGLKERVKFTGGYFATLNNPMQVTYNNAVYNYLLSNLNEEIIRDTALYDVDVKSTIRLPLEQGFGLGFKKGERFNFVTDFAITDWTKFRYLENTGDLLKNYRIGAGLNFVPEKYAAGRGAFVRKINYRFGASYQTGYVRVEDKAVASYFVSVGVGLPVGIGRLSSMVNISLQYGQTGFNDKKLLRENFMRVNFGFTFSDKWFQKFRYD